jgi:hypothetical protein
MDTTADMPDNRSAMGSFVEDSGLDVLDLRTDALFASRNLHSRDVDAQLAGLQRLSRALLDRPDTILQELVNAAVDLCGADSAGISLEKEDGDDQKFYQWIATAGVYSGFLGAVLPRYPSACGVCLDRGHAQHFTVSKRFFDILGVEAPLITDGILLPWTAEETRGTIFVMAHGRTDAFDVNDTRLMTMLADFAAMGYRHRKQQARLIAQERAEAAAQMANQLAHQINNPLQSMTNAAYLLAESSDAESRTLGRAFSNDVARLSDLVKQILSLPLQTQRNGRF